MIAIKCRGVSKTYDPSGVQALKGLNLGIERNTVFGLIGPNGAGKTTALNLLTGLMPASAGEIEVAGERVRVDNVSFKGRIGVLGQDPSFYGWMTGRELIQFCGRLFGLHRDERDERAQTLLETAGLASAAERRISTYSGGMVQRLGIAQALVNEPEVLFLDEPCSSLDPVGRKEVLDFIGRVKHDTTVLMSSHILDDVERVCDVVGILNAGELVLVDTMASLRHGYAAPKLEFLFRDPADSIRFMELATAGLDPCAIEKRGERAIVLQSDDLDGIRRRSLRIVVEHELALERLTPSTSTLEDVFLNVLRKERHHAD